MIAALMLGASFGAEWAGVCPALWARPRMPWPRVLWYARVRGGNVQDRALEYAISEEWSSGSECATAKGRFQSPSLEGKRQAVVVYVVYLDGHGRATDPTGRLRFMAEVLPHVARQTTYDIILTAQAVEVGADAGGRQSQWDADGACLLVRTRLSLMSKDADNSPNPRRLKMNLHLLIVLALCGLLARPALAQATEITPTGSIPLEVGNQWTYYQHYGNYSYEWRRELAPETRTLFELPGYPYDDSGHPPDSLLWVERELTLEITHTERIDDLEYFVFSQADYDWPPLPTLFWAGQKVRLSDEDVLLFRWNGQDIPLYDFNLQHSSKYSIPAYPIREDLVTKLYVKRWNRDERQIEILFSVTPAINLPNNMPNDSITFIHVLPRYGLVSYSEVYYGGPSFSEGLFFEPILLFHNTLRPISAIISGEAVSYDQALRGDFDTHVQPSSWGQLKRTFRPR